MSTRAPTRSSAAKSRRVTADNLASLGAERLAQILFEVADTRADLKRRLRMELAAEQGASQLAAEIDKRLASFETSRGKITWRQRPAFIRDLDALRGLITQRLAPLDAGAASERLWRFIDSARPIGARYRARGDELEGVYARAAVDLGALLAAASPGLAAAALVESLVKNPSDWKAWLPGLLTGVSQVTAQEALRFMSERSGATPGWIPLVRQLADAAGDVEAYSATYTAEAARTPSVAADIARRRLAAGRIEDAGEILRDAAPEAGGRRRGKELVDFAWETAWIDYLDLAGRGAEAQDVRWSSFERTLSPERARAFVSRLADFEDVEAEMRAFAIASAFPDFQTGLAFLMEWPSLVEAAAMIEQRGEEIDITPEAAELWAGKLRGRYPKAALALLRKTAAAAFRRRDFKTCDRLTAEAEAIHL